MKNGENPANPISRIENCEFFPRRLSAKPAQVWRTNPSKSVKTDTRSLNQKPIQRDRASDQKTANSKMRIADASAQEAPT